MKNLLFTLFLLVSSFAWTQNDEVYNDDWYRSLDEPINFIVFPEPTSQRTIQFRIYRGSDSLYTVYVTDAMGNIIYHKELRQSDEIVLDEIQWGIYYIFAHDSAGNSISKRFTFY